MDISYSRFDVIFFTGVLFSTLDIGPWNLQFVFGFHKVNRCQRSIEKHCKSLKLKTLKRFSLLLCIINIDGDTKDLNNLTDI